MVLPLRPGKFYGRSLPRPRIYTDLKFNSERVDPPEGVTAPLMWWARDALWSMGGLSLKRKRMQGKIEGSAKRLKTLDEGKEKEQRGGKKNGEAGDGSENVAVTSSSDSETLKVRATASPRFSSYSTPRSVQIFKPKWVHEDNTDSESNSLVVPESAQKSVKKPSPKVRFRVRKLGDIFNQEAESNRGHCKTVERPEVESIARSALRKQAKKVMQVYDFIETPDRVVQVAATRRSPRKFNKEKDPVASTSFSSEGTVRRT